MSDHSFEKVDTDKMPADNELHEEFTEPNRIDFDIEPEKYADSNDHWEAEGLRELGQHAAHNNNHVIMHDHEVEGQQVFDHHHQDVNGLDHHEEQPTKSAHHNNQQQVEFDSDQFERQQSPDVQQQQQQQRQSGEKVPKPKADQQHQQQQKIKFDQPKEPKQKHHLPPDQDLDRGARVAAREAARKEELHAKAVS